MALASFGGPGSPLGALFAPRLVRGDTEELYDYDVVRQLTERTMFVVRVAGPTVVLGGSQPASVLQRDREDVVVRRRRGGGGCVYLQPDDLWIDWWIPRADECWMLDVHEASYVVGEWWSAALRDQGLAPVMHQGRVIDQPDYRVVCFSGRGPGEVFLGERKAVGVTQWRVREGLFLSTVMHAHSSEPLLDFLATVPAGLGEALDHVTWPSAGIDADGLLSSLHEQSSPSTLRNLFLLA